MRYAGFWVRAIAWWIDFVILMLASWILELFITGLFYWSLRLSGAASVEGRSLEEFLNASDAIGLQVTVMAIFLAMDYLYFAIGYVRFGTTLGKRLFGLEVVRLSDGERMGYLEVFLRWIGALVSFVFFGSGYLMAAFHPKKRALHDVIAGTVVVRRRADSLEAANSISVPPSR